ncbi:VirK/YbjX family protein [Chitinilyticum aquatile]|uniref:VirK/YbjX family protein n=1 Tax=Chitinilyticum aquatile TaxID=362520 RepID=UPI0003F993BD|nr:DUF535 family protein [Chitinilyticum aquatile]
MEWDWEAGKRDGFGQWFDDVRWACRMRFANGDVRLHRKLRLVFRSLLQPRSSARWFAFLRHSPLSAVLGREPEFIERVHRPFFDCRLPADAVCDVLIGHFRHFHSRFRAEQAAAIMRGEGIELARLPGKSGESCRLLLNRFGKFDKEGGLCLQLVTADTWLQALSFSLVTRNGQTGLLIGGMQGKKDGRELIRAVTRDLHGIQPRLLLLDALRDVARVCGCAFIDAIASENHVYASPRYRHRHRKDIRLDYEEVWLAAGGIRQVSGHFSIPLARECVSIADRPARKRAEDRRRGELQESLQRQIQASLQQALLPRDVAGTANRPSRSGMTEVHHAVAVSA